jgi:class 3 adenylate cyclase
MVDAGLAADDPSSVHILADLALALREASRDLSIDGIGPLELRFGIDVGPGIAGVVGEQTLSYVLFLGTWSTQRAGWRPTEGRVGSR